MSCTKLTFYEDESLEIVKEVFGKQHTFLLLPRIRKLNGIKQLKRISQRKALDACIKSTKTTAELIMLLAAHHYIMKNAIAEYQEATKLIGLYNKQLGYLEHNTHMNETEKAEMRTHYRKKLNALFKQRTKLMECPEVRKQIMLIHKQVKSTLN